MCAGGNGKVTELDRGRTGPGNTVEMVAESAAVSCAPPVARETDTGLVVSRPTQLQMQSLIIATVALPRISEQMLPCPRNPPSPVGAPPLALTLRRKGPNRIALYMSHMCSRASDSSHVT